MADDLEAIAAEAAERHGIPKSWFLSLIGKGEGGFRNPHGVSPKGAQGPGQLMPSTAAAMGVKDPQDLAQNIEGSASYAASLYNKFSGNTKKATAAYNAGPGAVQKAGGVPHIKETKDYTKRVGVETAEEFLDTPDLEDAGHFLDAKPMPDVSRGPTHISSAEIARRMGVPPKPSAASQAAAPLANVPRDIGHEFMEAARGNQAAFQAWQRTHQPGTRPTVGQLFNPLPGVELGVNTLRQLFSPVTGTAHAVVGRPVTNITGSPVAGQLAETAATLAAPVAEEAQLASRTARVAREGQISAATARRAVEAQRMAQPNRLAAVTKPRNPQQAAHQSAAARLEAEGQYLTPGQRAGGLPKIREDRAETGSPYVGPAVAEARQASSESFNRVGYNRALAPIGEAVNTRGGPVGHEGLADVETRLSGAYTKALRNARSVDDPTLNEDFDKVRAQAQTLAPERRARLDDIIKGVVLRKFGPDHAMDGATFKAVEGDLRAKARGLKGDQSSEERELGRRLDDVANALRRSLDRHSPPQTVTELKKADTGYAIFKRLQRATRNAGHPDGVFTPKELRMAIRTMDTSLDKGAFARGDAILQDLARDAQTVLPNKVRDPGTAAQMKAGIAGRVLGGMAGAGFGHMIPGLGGLGAEVGAGLGYAAGEPIDRAVGSITNQLARRSLMKAERNAQVRNYLAAAQHRLKGAYLPAAAAPLALPPPRQQ